jgi:hypothetical protein
VLVGEFSAAVDPTVHIDVLSSRDDSLESYLSVYHSWIMSRLSEVNGGEASLRGQLYPSLDQFLGTFLFPADGLGFEVHPLTFDIGEGASRSVALRIYAPELVQTFLAVRFTADDGEVYVSDLIPVSTPRT